MGDVVCMAEKSRRFMVRFIPYPAQHLTLRAQKVKIVSDISGLSGGDTVIIPPFVHNLI